MSIIISKNGKDAEKVEKSDFINEDYMQDYIHNNPEAIPIYEIQKDKKLFVVKRELSTNGPTDALAIDKDGDIYIIETKLFRNSDKRTVVAQALDYGRALWKHYNDFELLISEFNEETQKNFNLDFSEKLNDFFEIEEEQTENLTRTLRSNLNDGNFKFVILMDEMDERLKDLIVYVNQNSQFDIYAVQLEYYKFNENEIIIPKIFGVEVKKNIKNSGSSTRRQWNEEDFINQSKELLGENSEKIIELHRFFKEKADKINWGTGAKNGSFAPVFFKLGKNISPFSLYSDGRFWIKFRWFKSEVEKGTISKEYFEKIVEDFEGSWRKNAKIEFTKTFSDDLFEVSSEDFLKNYDGIVNSVKEFVDLVHRKNK